MRNNGTSGTTGMNGNGKMATEEGLGKSRNTRLTPTEQRIFARLSDLAWHRPAELLPCIDEDLVIAPGQEKDYMGALHAHLCRMRAKLHLSGKDVATIQAYGQTYYQLVATAPRQPE